jgi:radical SAM superfamily enzyme YgiQ (UPF0313 family)
VNLVLLVGSFRSVVPEGSDDPIGNQGGFVDTLAPAPYSLANAYLKAFVEADGDLRARFDVRLLNLAEPLELEDDHEEVTLSSEDIDRIVALNPSIIGFSTYCWNLDAILEASVEIEARLPEVRIVLGGRTSAADAHEILTRFKSVDAVVVGEGELPFREILRSDSFAGIAGVYARSGAEIRCGGPPRSVQRLDEIPSPWLAGILSPVKNAVMMELSRGCLHACGYCSWNSDKQLRYFSTERIEKELRWVVEHGHAHVTINDSALNYDTERLEAFVRAVRSADPSGQIRFTYNIRHDALTDAQLQTLSKLPTHMVLLGVETLSERGMSQVDRAPVDVQALRARLDALSHAVRPPVASIVLGLPEDDEKSFLETLDQLMSWTEPGPDGVPTVGTVLVSLLQVYRGSKLWERREALGLSFEQRGIPYLHESPTWPAASLARCKAELVRRIRKDPERLKAAEALAMMQQRGGVPPWLSRRVLGIVLREWPEGVTHDGWLLERIGWMRDTGQGALVRFGWKDGGRARVRITLDERAVRESRPGRYRVGVHPLPGPEMPEASLARLGKLVEAVVRGGEHRAAAFLAERRRRAMTE